MTYVQYGCGHSAPEGWLSYDASFTLRVERFSVMGQFVKRNAQRFPDNVIFGDIVRGLPVPDGSADGVYASHVLEHLSRASMLVALQNTYRILRPNGIFRLIVPDLEARARRYIAELEAALPDANDRLLRSSYLGVEADPKGLLGVASEMLGRNKHLWMWDFPAISAVLASTGFTAIRRCEIGDSGDPAFAAVEQRDRFFDGPTGIRELAVHCQRPASR
ncbi:MAG: methyltransferase domain-containing protein [Rhizobiales bacterium]|nr:methyltransferase domain-containing protein [Hyphomicrobiales bacterium]